MKCHVPEISWHNRDPILSVDFQPCNDKHDKCRRLASCGTDTHVMVWFVILHNNGSVSLEFRSDLNRHTKTVNVVRFSNNGELLASGDDEANIILWKQQEMHAGDLFDDSIENKEHWVAHKVLRGHIDDICDLAWSPDDRHMASGSVDNTSIVWDILRGKSTAVLKKNKGFVQGVSWDPRNAYFATLSSDRSMHIFNALNKKVAHRIEKIVIPQAKLKEEGKATRIFYDDTLKSFCRRLSFSPDGEVLVAPCGVIEHDEGRVSNTVYVFARTNLSEPAYYLPVGDKPSLAVRFCPLFFKLRSLADSRPQSDATEDQVVDEPLFRLPYRMVFAVATQNSILLYDTQQSAPFAHISNIHYTRLSDLAWSPDGLILVASSTDGFCSIITFSSGEIGELYDGALPFKELGNEDSPSPPDTKENSTQKEKIAISLCNGSGEACTDRHIGEVGNVLEPMEMEVIANQVPAEKHSPDETESNGNSCPPTEKRREPTTIPDKEPMDIHPKPESSCGRKDVSPTVPGASESRTSAKSPRRVQLITLSSKKL